MVPCLGGAVLEDEGCCVLVGWQNGLPRNSSVTKNGTLAVGVESRGTHTILKHMEGVRRDSKK